MRTWWSIYGVYGVIEEGDDGKTKGIGGESFAFGFPGMHTSQDDQGDSDGKESKQDKAGEWPQPC